MERAEALVTGRHPGLRLELGDETGVDLGGGEGQLQQLGLAEAELADRRQHPGRDAGRSGRRLGSGGGPGWRARLRQAPSSGESDDPTSDDDRVIAALL